MVSQSHPNMYSVFSQRIFIIPEFIIFEALVVDYYALNELWVLFWLTLGLVRLLNM